MSGAAGPASLFSVQGGPSAAAPAKTGSTQRSTVRPVRRVAGEFLPIGGGMIHLPDMTQLMQAEEGGILARQQDSPPVEADAPRSLPVPAATPPAAPLVPHGRPRLTRNRDGAPALPAGAADVAPPAAGTSGAGPLPPAHRPPPRNTSGSPAPPPAADAAPRLPPAEAHDRCGPRPRSPAASPLRAGRQMSAPSAAGKALPAKNSLPPLPPHRGGQVAAMPVPQRGISPSSQSGRSARENASGTTSCHSPAAVRQRRTRRAREERRTATSRSVPPFSRKVRPFRPIGQPLQTDGRSEGGVGGKGT